MLKDSDRKVGTRVRCVYRDDRFGKTGTICDVDSAWEKFYIKWDDGSSDSLGWSSNSSFELLEEYIDQPDYKIVCQSCGCYNKVDSASCWFCKKVPQDVQTTRIV